MASRTLTVVLAGDAKGALGALNQTSGGFGRLAKVAGVAALGAGAAFTAIGVKGVQSAKALQSGLAEVRTLLPDLTDNGFVKLRKDVLAFSDDMGVATREAVPALYQAISAGVPRDNVVDFLRTANKAAVGGVTDLQTAVDGISSVVNAYGADIISATQASDQMFTAVRLGKTNFEELSSSLFNVIPIASASGVEFGQVTAGLARLTAQGTPTSVATTQLRAAIQSLVAPTKEGAKIMADLGLSFDAATLKEKGLSGAFNDLHRATGGNIDQLRQIVGSVEAVQAILGLTGDNAEAFRHALDEMEGSAGATNKAFDLMRATLEYKWNKVVVRVENFLTQIGLKLMPVVTAAVDAAIPAFERMGRVFANDVVPWLRELWRGASTLADRFGVWLQPSILALAAAFRDDLLPQLQAFGGWLRDVAVPGVTAWIAENEKLVTSVLIAVGIMAGLAVAIKVITVVVGVATAVFGGLAAVIGFILSPVGLVIIAITALVAGFVYLYRTNEGFREFVHDKLLPALKAVGGFLLDVLGAAFRVVAGVITGVVLPVLGALAGFIAEKVFPVLVQVAGFLWEGLLTVFRGIGEWVQEYVVPAFRAIMDVVGAVWEFIRPFVAWMLDAFLGMIGAVVGFITEHWEPIFTILTAPFRLAWAFLKFVFKNIRATVEAALLLITGDWRGAFKKIAEIPKNFLALFKEALGIFLDVGAVFVNAGLSLGRKLMDALLGVLSGLGSAIRGVVSDAVSGLGSLVSDVIPGFATGGYVPPTPGGRVVRVAEGGEGEYIVPASRMSRGRGGGGNTYILQVDASGGDPQRIAEILFPALQALERDGQIMSVTA